MPIASKCLKKGMPFVAVLSICHNEAIVQLQTIKWYLVLASVLTLGVAGTLAIALYAHSSLSGRAIIWVGSAVSPTNRSIVLGAAGTWMRDNPSKNIFFKIFFHGWFVPCLWHEDVEYEYERCGQSGLTLTCNFWFLMQWSPTPHTKYIFVLAGSVISICLGPFSGDLLKIFWKCSF